MVEQFVGTWKMVDSDNFEEFLKEIGIGMAKRKAISHVKPDLIVSVDDQGMISIKMKSTLKTKEFQFKLNEPFEGTTMDDKTSTNVVSLESGKLIQKQTCENKEITFEREIVDGKLIMSWTRVQASTSELEKVRDWPPWRSTEAAKMVEQFVGSWKMVSSENFDEFLKAMGVGFAIRQVASRTKPSLIVTVDQGVICLKMLSSFKTTEVKFTLNEPFNETTPDGRKTTSTVSLENGKLVQIQTWDGKETTIEREIVNGKLVTTCTMAGVVAVRTFIREA